MADNFYWITGDPYFIVQAKNDLIKGICSKEEYEVKNISDLETISDIVAEVSGNSLFDSQKSIFVFNGELPDSGKGKAIIDSLGENIFFLLEEKPNKKTKFYKEFKDEIQDFPVVINNNRIDMSAQSKARNVIKFYSKWNGTNELFEAIFEYSGYSYGITINEIEKIRIMFGSEENVNFNQIKDILFGTGRPDSQKFVDLIKDGKKAESLNYLNFLVEEGFLDEIGMYVFYTLMSNYKFIQACVFARSEGAKTKDKIAELAAPLLGEEDPYKVSNRLYYYMDLVQKTNPEEISKKIRAVGLAMRDWLAGKQDRVLVMKKLVISVS